LQEPISTVRSMSAAHHATSKRDCRTTDSSPTATSTFAIRDDRLTSSPSVRSAQIAAIPDGVANGKTALCCHSRLAPVRGGERLKPRLLKQQAIPNQAEINLVTRIADIFGSTFKKIRRKIESSIYVRFT